MLEYTNTSTTMGTPELRTIKDAYRALVDRAMPFPDAIVCPAELIPRVREIVSDAHFIGAGYRPRLIQWPRIWFYRDADEREELLVELVVRHGLHVMHVTSDSQSYSL